MQSLIDSLPSAKKVESVCNTIVKIIEILLTFAAVIVAIDNGTYYEDGIEDVKF